MAAIRVEGLTKHYKEIKAVAGIDFEVQAGEIFGFLGPNGAGKTTTVQMLCTLLKPSGGRAWVNGFDVVRQQARVRESIGIVFQEPTLDERLTAWENLEFHGILYGVPRQHRHQRMSALLEMVELADRRNDFVRTFSGGMKRRLEIARGLLHYPKVLFLDEPTIGLDPQTRKRIWDYMLELRKREDLTIFLTTHYMDEAEVADHIGIIDYGRIVGLDTPEALKNMVGGDIINVRSADDAAFAAEIEARLGLKAQRNGESLSLEVSRGEELIPAIVQASPVRIKAISLRRPTLDDVFLKLTGHQIRDEELSEGDQMKERFRRFGRGRGH